MGRHQNTDETGKLFQRPPDPAFRRARGKMRKAGAFAATRGRSGRPGSSSRPGARSSPPLWTKVCVAFGTVISLLAFGACGAAYAINRKVESNLTRADLLGEHRGIGGVARAGTDRPLNLLLIGADSRQDDAPPEGEEGDAGAAADAPPGGVLLLHVPAGLDQAYVVSIPLDVQVVIPPLGEWEGGEDTLGTALAEGGTPLLTKTVDQLSGLTVSWPIVVDVARLRQLADVLGGVDVQFDKPVRDARTNRVFPAGRNHLTGAEAEALVGQSTPSAAPGVQKGAAAGGQLRPDQYLGALLEKIGSPPGGPGTLPELLAALTRALTVDTAMPIHDIALRLSGLEPESVFFYRLPVYVEPLGANTWRTVVSEDAARELFAAMKNGTMADYAADNPPSETVPAR